MSRIRAPLAAVLAASMLLLTGCEGGVSSIGGPLGLRWAHLSHYEQRCKQLNRAGALGRVVFESRRNMTRGDTELVTAAVTLAQAIPPSEILHRSDAQAEPGIVVSCVVQARLSVPPRQFELNKTGWIKRSLLTTDTASWNWYVKPKVGGTHTFVLGIRPIVQLRGPNDIAAFSVADADANVLEYPIAVRVHVPLAQWLPEKMSSLAAMLGVAEGLVKAMTALIVAVLALGTALGIRDRRKRASPSP